VRPAVVAGAPAGMTIVMWMHARGGYVHYTDFRSEIRVARMGAD
jgi:hypothetical protein